MSETSPNVTRHPETIQSNWISPLADDPRDEALTARDVTERVDSFHGREMSDCFGRRRERHCHDPQPPTAHECRRAAWVIFLTAGACFAATILLYIAISQFDYHQFFVPGRVLVSTAVWFLPSLTIFLAVLAANASAWSIILPGLAHLGRAPRLVSTAALVVSFTILSPIVVATLMLAAFYPLARLWY
ncbi:hypothetical protein [Frigoribacterium sp. UYMn621]|uniref:hypothetical protein n=1 Tax=Frigoribacterium sp. UYMn621 TaxID=3156343 RepID=UPI0033998AF4